MRLIQFVANRFDAFARRCWLTWRYIRALGYAPGVAWAKAARREAR
jgi:hypothetical protein